MKYNEMKILKNYWRIGLILQFNLYQLYLHFQKYSNKKKGENFLSFKTIHTWALYGKFIKAQAVTTHITLIKFSPQTPKFHLKLAWSRHLPHLIYHVYDSKIHRCWDASLAAMHAQDTRVFLYQKLSRGADCKIR